MRTQAGNNNAWCQDNPTGWLDWSLLERHHDLLRFTRELIALRKRHPSLQRRHFLSGRHRAPADVPDISWHGLELDDPCWNDESARVLAFTLAGRTDEEPYLHVLLNMDEIAHDFALPSVPGRAWRRAVDTGCEPPHDVAPPLEQPRVDEGRYRAEPRTLVVLEGW